MYSCNLIESYRDYLKGKVSNNSINVYSCKITRLLKQGYSENDIVGSVHKLIKDYSTDGVCFTKDDHGQTVAALKRLRNMFLEPYVENLSVQYKLGNAFWLKGPLGKPQYEIYGRYINSTRYKNLSEDLENSVKILPDKALFQLADILKRNELHLSDSNTLVKTSNGPMRMFCYSFNGKTGTHCRTLFNSIVANQEFREWERKYVR